MFLFNSSPKQPEGIYIAKILGSNKSLPTPYFLGANRQVHILSSSSSHSNTPSFVKIEIFSISKEDSTRSLSTKGMYVCGTANVYASTNQDESVASDQLLYQYCHSYGPCSNTSAFDKKDISDQSERRLPSGRKEAFWNVIKSDLGL
ncbi:hypothetical protein C9374_011665 [Naegleria lovaniensis]|uniref:Uncharacterized protein n=1 Tax=Naegleria lovaniensis TaxID=51637 RepID=A0AA88KCN5_NAELO|nr:uncharacterized protein C9374_011665 [Naegleria lovaniensis]KAG2374000.1 hypothetical protein C9374_011665 [Naegleria lovaniensis]